MGEKDVSPIIEEYAQKAKFPNQIISGLAEIGAFGPYIPEEYGGAGWIKSHMVSSCKRSNEEIREFDPQHRYNLL